ncbi:fungal ATP synthase protein 8-domain-containing protein [Geopyxis carbonaria]|nr:fungal ATP synthase protein 8-domain-containing protein [Geopyxis carbonaria]
MLRKLQRSFAAPIAKPHPFVKTTIQAGMPQLVPFYFINQVAFGFALLTTMVFLLSKYILPRMVRLFLSRTFITKL